MPIFKTNGKLVYYAHVPKCAGSSVEHYLSERFGSVAFQNVNYLDRPKALRWTRTSPQHVDAGALALLFPPGFFDICFTIVRHPVRRLVSAYHFQLEVERSIPPETSFHEWLEDMADLLREDPFAFDNHIRPMDDIVPAAAHVFHLENGLDQLVPWCDAITGNADGPRTIPRVNSRDTGKRQAKPQTVPSSEDIGRITQIFAADFKRFGYQPDPEAPVPAPLAHDNMHDAVIRARAAAQPPKPGTVEQLIGKLRRKLSG